MPDLGLVLLIISGCFAGGLLIPLIPLGATEAEKLALAGSDKPPQGFREPIPLPRPVIWGLLLTGAGSAISAVQALMYLLNQRMDGGEIPLQTGRLSVPWLPGMPPFLWQFSLDNLSAFFLFLIGAFSVGVAVYSLGALESRQYLRQRRQVAAAFSLFAWATLMVVLANDVFSLVALLEIMTLAFGFLALFKHKLYQEPDQGVHEREKLENAWLAPQVYMIISHLSTMLLILALALLAINAGSVVDSKGEYPFYPLAMSLDTFRKLHLSIQPELGAIIFLLALGGLGIRAGLFPAHIWVPLVHPNSPTTTHALSLGIAIKVAIYLMLRFFFQFLPVGAWEGYLVLGLAVITALLNVRYALVSHDLKTALAYHSIENIGIITAGIGVALIFHQNAWNPFIAVLALLAALYHLINHAVFKGLLYFATGAIDNLTAQVVDLDMLGGLAKRYQSTAAFFFIGAFAISGFPPLNGFVSEWLTVQALLTGIGALRIDSLNVASILFSTLALALLFASFALTAICFYKIAGITLLGYPRSSTNQWAPSGTDVSWYMRCVMAVFALCTLLLGLLPFLVIPLFMAPVCRTLGFAPDTVANTVKALNGSIPSSQLPILPAVIPTLIAGIALVVAAYVLVTGVNRGKGDLKPKDVIDQWNCGTQPDIALQPISESLVYLVQDSFALSSPDLNKIPPEYLPARLTESVIERIRNLYNAQFHTILRISERLGIVQDGDIRKPLAYILVTNLLAMIAFIIYQWRLGRS